MKRACCIMVMLVPCLLSFSCGNDDGAGTQVPTTGTIRGHVSNAAGDTALAGAIVLTLPPTSSVSTDNQGSYTIPNVRPKQYSVIASKDRYSQGSVDISVDAGETTTADIHLSSLAQNRAPDQPILAFPAQSSIHQPTTLTLKWTCLDPDGDQVSYDVYFGTSSPPSAVISFSQTSNSLVRFELDTLTTWYWRVVAKDNHHATTIGDIWSFTTASTRVTEMLYLRAGDPLTWTTPGAERSQYAEIQRWRAASFSVTTQDLSTTVITEDLLGPYQVLRLTCPEGGEIGRSISPTEATAIYSWVRSGGRLFADVSWNGQVSFVTPFGIDRIDGSGGGSSGLDWYFHGAPLTFGPSSGPDYSVTQMACEVMDRPILKSGHSLTVAASIGGYPAIVYGEFGSGKTVIVFVGGWSWDATSPGNAYRADIYQADNLQFLGNVIHYLSR